MLCQCLFLVTPRPALTICSNQIIQKKLADMLTEITLGLTTVIQVTICCSSRVSCGGRASNCLRLYARAYPYNPSSARSELSLLTTPLWLLSSEALCVLWS